jgi:hypothetical protein
VIVATIDRANGAPSSRATDRFQGGIVRFIERPKRGHPENQKGPAPPEAKGTFRDSEKRKRTPLPTRQRPFRSYLAFRSAIDGFPRLRRASSIPSKIRSWILRRSSKAASRKASCTASGR